KTNEVNAKIVIFSNPCNPTGWVCPRSHLEAFIRDSKSIVIVDEAYMEFAPTNESVIDLTEKYDNLIVLKTMSKAYGAAALRLGFSISNKAVASAIRKIKSPYNVNTVSQVFGEIILSHYDEIKEKTAQIKENLAYLRGELEGIASDKIVKLCPSAANFVYLKMCCADTARAIHQKLLSQGVAIRCMSNGYLRICGGTREEIDTFIKKFKEAIL
ncbi:MAG: histidinol-phosphate aminotransferase family protein, partial [Clostridia bacterium]|nr:histidinol-phosphate aminotransferase family protein [Clostridia bacterium]